MTTIIILMVSQVFSANIILILNSNCLWDSNGQSVVVLLAEIEPSHSRGY